jgi:hypothetical protein
MSISKNKRFDFGQSGQIGYLPNIGGQVYGYSDQFASHQQVLNW